MKKIILCSFIFIFNLNCDPQKFVIGSRLDGFFSNFLGTLTNIIWAERNNKIPVVSWERSLYFQPEGYNESNNVWEYYFEPVSKLKKIKDDIVYSNYYSPDKFGINAWSDLAYNSTYRSLFNSIIKKYVKIKPNIQNTINAFYKKNMQGKTNIGIHIRGTDKFTEISRVNSKKILDYANQLAQNFGKKCQFFIATDEENIIKLAQSCLSSKVVFYDAHRSNNSNPVWKVFKQNKALLGEEILIESQLLSKCDYFIHTISNVSIAVCYFNPSLKNILLKN
ncbi:MAG: hypothetical protein P4L22_03430 [Candidatus Babeliales bacterium]|nr:hypothetical protein [Candidatus Babeliales bacterium]